LICYGLEDAVREVPGVPVEEWKIPGKTAIPYGKYPLEITYSNRFKRDTMQVMDVPGFEGIRIHAGNVASESEGCLLVGTSMGQDRVNNSKMGLLKLWRLVYYALNNGGMATIEFVKDSA
jgi:hypothetical protein